MSEWHLRNKEYLHQYYLENIERFRQQNKKWNLENKERRNELARIRLTDPEKRQRARESTRQWRLKNKAYDAMRARERRAIQLQAMPIWVNRDEILAIYKNCPPGYHVDHIFPLKHNQLSGLHVPWNLQYLPALENIRKKNYVIL